MQKIIPCLWFDKDAEEAMNFYVSVFSKSQEETESSKIVSIKRYPEEVPEEFMKGMEGKVLTGLFELAGHRFMALDGGPIFKFTPAISFFVRCHSKDDVDVYWSRLSDGGTVLMPLDTYPFSQKYGWIQDKYGISWQVLLAESAIEQNLVPSLMFVGEQAGKAEEAINFYAEVFGDAAVGDIARYSANQEPERQGTIAYADFRLEGQPFAAMDSARQHDFTFNEAISFYVECETQEEVDTLWEKLSAVPESEQCGWLKDKYRISWQIIPKQLGALMNDPDPEKSGRVMKAILKMKKIDIAKLEEAYRQSA
ncbi:MAG: VOC family protein [Chloroflexi bacterium]|nr:VOC family protein [Chloroflexota bacterium]